MKADVFRDGATRTPGMNLMKAGMLGVPVGLAPCFEQVGPAGGGDEQFFERLAFVMLVEDIDVSFLFGVVEAREGLEDRERQFFPGAGNHAHAYAGIESGDEIAPGGSVDGNFCRAGVSGLHSDPDVVDMSRIAVLFGTSFQSSTDGMGEGNVPKHRIVGNRNLL